MKTEGIDECGTKHLVSGSPDSGWIGTECSNEGSGLWIQVFMNCLVVKQDRSHKSTLRSFTGFQQRTCSEDLFERLHQPGQVPPHKPSKPFRGRCRLQPCSKVHGNV